VIRFAPVEALSRHPRRVVSYAVDPSDDWVLEDDKVPESSPHDRIARRVDDLLRRWAKQARRSVLVGRNLAIRFDEHKPQLGTDPDVFVLEPPPPEGDELMSLRLWEPGHEAPKLVVEIVSPSRPTKDYTSAPDKYAVIGVEELWIFDPKLAGPKTHGGPFRIQVWRRRDDAFTRVYAGPGPAWSVFASGWLFAVNEGRMLAIAEDQAGTRWWMTGEETERHEKEAERRDKEVALLQKAEAVRTLEAERAEKEALLGRLRELEGKR
jgi:hypothetical protein